ncbi:hypothetical protein AAMO2058_001450900 [Amorphochlora amoebiformis]
MSSSWGHGSGGSGGGSSLFGSGGSSGGFGSSSTSGFGSGSSLFGGGSSRGNSGGSLFGSSRGGGGFGSSSGFGGSGGYGGGGGFGGGMDGGMDPDNPEKAIFAIKEAYTAKGKNAQFQAILYNKVHRQTAHEVNRLKKKPPGLDIQQFKLGLENNPDPENLIPVVAYGFADLKKRINENHITAFSNLQKKINQLKKKIEDMKNEHVRIVEQLIPAAKKRHNNLKHRLLKVMGALEQHRAARCPLMSAEIDFLKQLVQIRRELRRPTMFSSKLQELDSIVRIQEDISSDAAIVLDTENLRSVHAFLHRQTKGLKHLTDVLQKNLRDIRIIENGLADRA